MNSLVRNAGRSMLKQSQFQTKSSFSTLATLLKREIVEETQTNPIEMPEDLMELKKILSTKWTIVDGSTTGDDGATVKMFRKEPTSNGAKVFLKFHCQDTVQVEDTLLDDEELSAPLQFEVEITLAGKIMKMACTSEDAVALIDGITITSDASTDKDGESYRGPILEDLPEDIKEEFEHYLREECGVDEDVAAFTAMYADFREQSEYIRWIKEVKKIVE